MCAVDKKNMTRFSSVGEMHLKNRNKNSSEGKEEEEEEEPPQEPSPQPSPKESNSVDDDSEESIISQWEIPKTQAMKRLIAVSVMLLFAIGVGIGWGFVIIFRVSISKCSLCNYVI